MEARRVHLRASLLDRLVGVRPEAPDEQGMLRTQSEPELRAAVRRDLEVLLSTRRGTPAPRPAARGRMVHDYGVQDFLHLSPHSEADRRQMATVIKEAVEAFEPRLRQVQVRVERYTDEALSAHPERIEALLIYIDGLLTIDAVQEPVSFPFVVRR